MSTHCNHSSAWAMQWNLYRMGRTAYLKVGKLGHLQKGSAERGFPDLTWSENKAEQIGRKMSKSEQIGAFPESPQTRVAKAADLPPTQPHCLGCLMWACPFLINFSADKKSLKCVCIGFCMLLIVLLMTDKSVVFVFRP